MAALQAKRLLDELTKFASRQESLSDDFPTLQEALTSPTTAAKPKRAAHTVTSALLALKSLEKGLLLVVVSRCQRELVWAWYAFVMDHLRHAFGPSPEATFRSRPEAAKATLSKFGFHSACTLEALAVLMEEAICLRNECRRCVPWGAHLSPPDRIQSILRFVALADSVVHRTDVDEISRVGLTQKDSQDMTTALDLGTSLSTYVPWLAPEQRARFLALRTTCLLLESNAEQLLQHDFLRNFVMTQLYWYPSAVGPLILNFFDNAVRDKQLFCMTRTEQRALESIVAVVFSTHAPQLQDQFVLSLEAANSLTQSGAHRQDRFAWQLFCRMVRGGCPRAMSALLECLTLWPAESVEDLLRDREGRGADVLNSALQIRPWSVAETWELQTAVIMTCASFATESTGKALLGLSRAMSGSKCYFLPPSRKREMLGDNLRERMALIAARYNLAANPQMHQLWHATLEDCAPCYRCSEHLACHARPAESQLRSFCQSLLVPLVLPLHEDHDTFMAAQCGIDAVFEAMCHTQIPVTLYEDNGLWQTFGPSVCGLSEFVADSLEAALFLWPLDQPLDFVSGNAFSTAMIQPEAHRSIPEFNSSGELDDGPTVTIAEAAPAAVATTELSAQPSGALPAAALAPADELAQHWLLIQQSRYAWHAWRDDCDA